MGLLLHVGYYSAYGFDNGDDERAVCRRSRVLLEGNSKRLKEMHKNYVAI